MRPVVLEPAANLDVAEALAWYEEQRPGLGDEFLDDLSATLGRIEENPAHFHFERGDIRKALAERFPYLILFVELPDTLSVIAVLHARRDPTVWHLRADG